MTSLNTERELLESLDLDNLEDVSKFNPEDYEWDKDGWKSNTEEDMDSIEESAEEFEFIGFRTVSSINTSSSIGGNRGCGGLTIVNSKKNGKRITLTKKWWNALNSPAIIQFAMKENVLVLGANLGDDYHSFSWNTNNQKPVLYNSGLVEELVRFYDLDYSNGRTSLSFGNIELKKINGQPALLIKVT